MSRIRKAYEARFRALLLRLRARRLEQGVTWLTTRARERSARPGVPVTQALGDLYEQLREQVHRWQRRAHPISEPIGSASGATPSAPRRFLCDAGLGGLARWLRAAGYEALWLPELGDAAVVQKARDLRATLLTTDSLLMERKVVRDGVVAAFWLPPTLTKERQLALVLREFDLAVLAPRCMRCGGELRRAQKEAMRDRIPPKTWLWLDEYFLCDHCGQLFWHGTHWRKIAGSLRRSGPGSP
jgi:uncharacterized protein